MYGAKGTIIKIYGPKKLQYESTNIIQINLLGAKQKHCKMFRDTFMSLQNAGLGKLLEFQVIQSNEAKTDAYLPFFLEYGIGTSKLIPFIFMICNSDRVIKTGSYYELKQSGIKENGMTNFSKKINEYTKNKSFSNEKLTAFYRRLIDVND